MKTCRKCGFEGTEYLFTKNGNMCKQNQKEGLKRTRHHKK